MAQYPMYGGYNPYGTYQQPMQYQPMDRLAQLQQNYQNTIPQYQQPQVQNFGLNGEIVDSIDVVKAKNVDMSGNPTIYPKSDFTEIYVKQLQMDGTSRTDIYRKVVPESTQVPVQQPVNMDVLNGMFGQLKQDLLQEINGIKEMIPAFMSGASTEPQKNQRGGNQK